MAENSGIAWTTARAVPLFPAYRVGTDGTVYTCWSAGGRRRRLTNRWRIKKPDRRHAGHLKVTLYAEDGRRRKVMVSVLVLELFAGPAPKGKPFALHADDNPENNSAENLYWGSNADNSADMVRRGRSLRGERHPRSSLTNLQRADARRRFSEGESQSSIARSMNVTPQAIHLIVRNKNGVGCG